MSELMKTSLPFSMNFRLQKNRYILRTIVIWRKKNKKLALPFSPFGVTVLETKFLVNRAENIKTNSKFQSNEQGLSTSNSGSSGIMHFFPANYALFFAQNYAPKILDYANCAIFLS